MRLIATTLACVLAAFGAAFLIGRAANNHQGSATAATVITIRTASRPAPVSTVRVNRALAAQFEPGLHGLRHRPKVHRRRVVHHAAPASPSAPVTSAPTPTQTVTPAPTPAPTYSAPRTTAPPATTHHKSGGSGTTTIG